MELLAGVSRSGEINKINYQIKDLFRSQLECDAEWRPRSGCTQWFTGVTGTLQSYNFAGGIHLANQDYAICIRQEAGYCSIEYTADTFKVSLGLDSLNHASSSTPDNIPLVNTKSGVDNIVCQTDYVLIPQGKILIIITTKSHMTVYSFLYKRKER